jgi:hypothetical protein
MSTSSGPAGSSSTPAAVPTPEAIPRPAASSSAPLVHAAAAGGATSDRLRGGLADAGTSSAGVGGGIGSSDRVLSLSLQRGLDDAFTADLMLMCARHEGIPLDDGMEECLREIAGQISAAGATRGKFLRRVAAVPPGVYQMPLAAKNWVDNIVEFMDAALAGSDD